MRRRRERPQSLTHLDVAEGGVMGPDRPRHPKKEWERLLRDAEVRGHRVTKKRGYFRVWCRCGDNVESIPLSPSGCRTLLNKTKRLQGWSCWEPEEGATP